MIVVVVVVEKEYTANNANYYFGSTQCCWGI